MSKFFNFIDTTKPNIPVKIYLQEAENLYNWEQDAPAAYALRDHLLRSMRYAYRGDHKLLDRVADIAKGNGHADMIQDLNDIATLGRANADALAAIGVAAEQLEQAAATSDAMGELLAQVNGERASGSGSILIRDQAYTHLKEAVDEVRDAGQYVFWDNEARLEGYYIKYNRSSSSRRSSTTNTSTTNSSTTTSQQDFNS